MSSSSCCGALVDVGVVGDEVGVVVAGVVVAGVVVAGVVVAVVLPTGAEAGKRVLATGGMEAVAPGLVFVLGAVEVAVELRSKNLGLAVRFAMRGLPE